MEMSEKEGGAAAKPSSLRWSILRRALLPRSHHTGKLISPLITHTLVYIYMYPIIVIKYSIYGQINTILKLGLSVFLGRLLMDLI